MFNLLREWVRAVTCRILDTWSYIAHPTAGITTVELESVIRVFNASAYTEIDLAVAIHWLRRSEQRGPICVSRREYVALEFIIESELIDVRPDLSDEMLKTMHHFLKRVYRW